MLFYLELKRQLGQSGPNCSQNDNPGKMLAIQRARKETDWVDEGSPREAQVALADTP